MNCPVCSKQIQKIRSEISSNLETGSDLKEYDKITYQCEIDDVWVTTEIPKAKQQPA